jgi:hypothetical protein
MLEEETPAERDEFPEEVMEDVDGLLWLGYLEDVIHYCGHEFVIRTLRSEEQLLAAYVTKDYANTLGQAKAWMAAHVGLALVSVDGNEHFCDQAGFNKKDFARARFNYITSKWFEPTINKIYDSYAQLLERQAIVLEEMENLSQENRITFMDSQDSSTLRADSQTVVDIMELMKEDEQV